ncbi:MAG: RidA family protein [Acidobacteria bacterium]|nr:RidA family protein [Acidobacteriota bacterium]MBS1866268.1 RidA family protein [Acidobacteriota bacterium]
MEFNARRSFLGKIAAASAVLAGSPKLFAQQPASPASAVPGTESPSRTRASHVVNGVYYFSGTGSNDGYGKEDHVLVTDPFEKHVSRTMDALKRNVEHAGSNMDSLLHLDVFICLPHADGVPMPAGKARFDAHKAQCDALNKIYRTYFAEGKAPSRACMAVEWIPGDSLIEITGTALVVNAPSVSEK